MEEVNLNHNYVNIEEIKQQLENLSQRLAAIEAASQISVKGADFNIGDVVRKLVELHQ